MRTICVSLTAVLALGLAASASAQPIIKVDKHCKAKSAPDLEVDPNVTTVLIKVYSLCPSSSAAVPGAFLALDLNGKNFFPALSCAYQDDNATTNLGEKVGTITCTVNAACPGDYAYSVCVAGKWFFDPEIRIKGGTRTFSCGATTVKPPPPQGCTHN
jgi:hypothetical protein